jgi:hypothetical protein
MATKDVLDRGATAQLRLQLKASAAQIRVIARARLSETPPTHVHHRGEREMKHVRPPPDREAMPLDPTADDPPPSHRSAVTICRGEKIMAKVYIEARPKGRPEGSPIEDFVVEEQGDRVLKTFKTQAAAITWAKSQGHSPHVARVRHLNDKNIPDHWRAV